MRVFKGALLACIVMVPAAAQAPAPPLSDLRLTVHTLLREDIFAGFMGNNMSRFSRAEQNIDVLLKDRPDQRANLLAWKAGTLLYRAVLAHEAGRAADFSRLYDEAREGFASAAAIETGNDGVAAITGGSLAVFADRLPGDRRAAAWSQAYDAYSILWRQQGAGIEKLPVHHRGEVLAGLAQSAQRTGRSVEAGQHLDTMLDLLANTRYEPMALQWKRDPASAATTNLTCQNCHNPGRLAARLAELEK